jgi:lactoylglutathione lyase
MVNAQINLIVLYVNDIERSVDFYQQIGLQFIKHQHGNGPEHYTCEATPLVFELYPKTEKSVHANSLRIGFRVSSMDEIIKNLERKRYTTSSPKTTVWGLRMVIQDPDKNHVEVVEELKS